MPIRRTGQLVVGQRGINICRRCVQICNEILDERAVLRVPGAWQPRDSLKRRWKANARWKARGVPDIS
jgi:ClpX C4-type zinc finger